MVDDGINTSNNNNNNPEGEDREINLYAVFFKYMVYWPWFVASVLACCIGMYVFLRYQTPVYNVTSSVLIKEDEKKGANAASGLAAIQDLGMLSMTSNFDNEVEILRSRTLIKKVVNDMGLYIDMEESNALGFNPPLYKNSPVNVFITPEEADRLVAPVELRMRYTKEGQLTVRAEYKIDKEGDEETMELRQAPRHIAHPRGGFQFHGHGFHTRVGGRGDRAGGPRPYAHVHCRGLRQGVERDALVQDDDDRQGILEEHGEATRR